MRKPEDYAKGHIPGAINILWTQVAKPENMAKLPPNKPIAVYCYTGHTGMVATTVLGMMGYDVHNIKYGMMAWTKDDNVLATARFDPATQPDYRLEKAVAVTPAALPTTGGVLVWHEIAAVGLIVVGLLSLSTGVVGFFVSRRKAS